jgi:hypothetical protein
MAGGPDGTLAPTSPVSLRLFSQRLIEGSETPKILATSLRGIPRSTASNTFSLRSFEYALMPRRFAEDQVSRKPLVGTKVPSDRRRGGGLPGLKLQFHLRDRPSSLSRHQLPFLAVDPAKAHLLVGADGGRARRGGRAPRARSGPSGRSSGQPSRRSSPRERAS